MHRVKVLDDKSLNLAHANIIVKRLVVSLV